MNKTYKSILILVTLMIIMLMCLFNASFVIQNILEYSKLFITKLFPVSFLFFVLSSLILDYGFINILEKYFHINATNIYLFFVSKLSGFPSGAKYTKDLLEGGFINKDMADKYIMFSHFPNPLFILGSVNMVLDDINMSIKLLLAIIISNFIIHRYFNCKQK